jgi:hypothetical protein
MSIYRNKKSKCFVQLRKAFFEMETIFGVDQVFDRVHVCDGELKEIHSFYYPQPNQTTGVP